MAYELDELKYIVRQLSIAGDALGMARKAMNEDDYNLKGYDKMLAQVLNYVYEYQSKYGRALMEGRE